MHWSDEVIKEYQKFYRLAFAYVKNEQDAMDVVQEAYLHALKGEAGLKREEYALTWFYRIVMNTAITFLKRRSRLVSLGEMEDVEAQEITDFSHERTECRQILGQVINILPHKYRTIIMLRFVSDKKLSEIAAILNLSENTVKTRLYTALRKLRSELKESGLEEAL
jgi:RNA polymerase sigma-70 factor (ECF subfamily)